MMPITVNEISVVTMEQNSKNNHVWNNASISNGNGADCYKDTGTKYNLQTFVPRYIAVK